MMSAPLARILLVEDNPGDVELVRVAVEENKLCNDLHVVTDGMEAMEFLRREGPHADAPRPDLILLDLNLPRMNGQEVLAEIKADAVLKDIPVVILTTSEQDEDIVRAYKHAANCYITKPVDIDQLIRVVQAIEQFWFGIVRLPPNGSTF